MFRTPCLFVILAGIMFLAWIGFATVGMFTSRYRKSAWGEKKLFNGNIWFRVRICYHAVQQYSSESSPS